MTAVHTPKKKRNLKTGIGMNNDVYEIVRQIPYGRIISYGQIARLIGRPKSARAVGRAMRNCPNDLPWHRVVRSDGSIAGGEFSELRRVLLQEEHIPFLNNGNIDMKKCFWGGS